MGFQNKTENMTKEEQIKEQQRNMDVCVQVVYRVHENKSVKNKQIVLLFILRPTQPKPSRGPPQVDATLFHFSSSFFNFFLERLKPSPNSIVHHHHPLPPTSLTHEASSSGLGSIRDERTGW